MAWAFERARAWTKAQDLVAHPVAFSHPKKGYEVIIFPDASNLGCGGFVTYVPRDGMDTATSRLRTRGWMSRGCGIVRGVAGLSLLVLDEDP